MDLLFRRSLLKTLVLTLGSTAWFSQASATQSVCLGAFENSKQYGLITLSRALPAKNNLKLGFYFGTFDPLHEGHVAVMQDGLASANPSRV
jgi:bifunctional ADP-heptose synthase (sugar kinase/adenylyltransferase)